jgi:hypothetical protein
LSRREESFPEKIMRYTILAAALLATGFAGAASAQSTTNTEDKYCAQMKGDVDQPARCTYKTMAQCQETVKSDVGTCIENPKFKGKM